MVWLKLEAHCINDHATIYLDNLYLVDRFPICLVHVNINLSVKKFKLMGVETKLGMKISHEKSIFILATMESNKIIPKKIAIR